MREYIGKGCVLAGIKFLLPEEEDITMSEANKKQVAGDHYKTTIQHWDYVIANDLDYFQAQITKYVTRYKKKNGLQDLYKAQHFLEKLIEIEQDRRNRQMLGDAVEAGVEAGSAYVNQDR